MHSNIETMKIIFSRPIKQGKGTARHGAARPELTVPAAATTRQLERQRRLTLEQTYECAARPALPFPALAFPAALPCSSHPFSPQTRALVRALLDAGGLAGRARPGRTVPLRRREFHEG